MVVVYHIKPAAVAVQNFKNFKNYKKMKKLFIVINECYGGFPIYGLKREYNSVEEFVETMRRLINLTKDEITSKYGGWHPLTGSNPVLYEIDLADGEGYQIDEYDGYESLSIYKKAKTQSKIVSMHGFDLSILDEE